MPSPGKTAIFIDGANLHATTKALQMDIDFKRLLAHFRATTDLVRAFYYTAMLDDQEYSSLRPLVDWLDYNGYQVVTKPAKEFVDSQGRRKIKGNMDIELAIDAMELSPVIDNMLLFSGDGDFRSLVDAVQRRGVRVTVFSTIETKPAMIADDLRRQADEFVELDGMRNLIGRTQDRQDRTVRRDARPQGDGLETRYGIRNDQDQR